MNKPKPEVTRCLRATFRLAFASVALSLALSGCLSPPKPSSATQRGVPQQPAASLPTESPSPLSYGAITTTVKKGVTTQADLVSLFGGPNIATLDSDGSETWVYEKTATETTTTSRQLVATQAERLDVFFGLGMLRKASIAGQSSGDTTVSHSIKTLTVIVKFNQDKTVKDFSVRASYF